MDDAVIRTEVNRGLVDAELTYDGCVNYAIQQNDVPVVKTLVLCNPTEQALGDLEVVLITEPAVSFPWQGRIARLEAGGRWGTGNVDLRLQPGALALQTERSRGMLWLEVRREGEILLSRAYPLEVLAYDEWSGLRSLPELLAAFVMPNDPAVEDVLSVASVLLREWTGDGSLSGYQCGDPRRIWMTGASVYMALQNAGIAYINPPASFEATGQKVRTPGRVLAKQLGTCLDLTVLAAACLEQASLNPLILIKRGHAFPGFWLRNECLAEATTDDLQAIRKRADLHEIAVFEATAVTADPPRPFNVAEADAADHLVDDKSFEMVIDVHRARKSRILPLPILEASSAAAPGAAASRQTVARRPVLPHWSDTDLEQIGPTAQVDEPTAGEDPASRLERWKRKLLDLSLRNRLLNFKDTKKSLPILCPALGRLETALAGGGSFDVRPRPSLMAEENQRSGAVHRQRTGQDAVEEFLLSQLADSHLHADVTETDLDRRLLEIYRAARMSLEESGANTLYLALGFLEWKRASSEDRSFRAPILMLPVELDRKSVQHGFRLRLSDDEPRLNVTLMQMLEADHGLVIPGLDPLPEDDSGIDVTRVLRLFKAAVKEVPGWEVREDAWLGLFSFTKLLMWKDLEEQAEEMMATPVVDHLVNHPHEPFDAGGVFPATERLDDERSPVRTFCPLDADSSQLAAVFAAAEGRSFVLEGPPGTGKSQTITNMIAHCLAEGRTVLFVSEKMAALDVVKRRLERVGLGQFCLALHSNKTRKQEVLAQLATSLQAADERPPGNWEREAARLQGLRDDLNSYVRVLHARRPSGHSAFQALSRLVGLADVADVSLRWASLHAVDHDHYDRLVEAVDRAAAAAATCNGVATHPWAASALEDWSPLSKDETEQAVQNLGAAADELGGHARNAAKSLGLPEDGWSLEQLQLMSKVASLLLESPGAPSKLVTGEEWQATEACVREWIRCGRGRDALRESLFDEHDESILQTELDELSRRWQRASGSRSPLALWTRWSVRGALKPYCKDGRRPAVNTVGEVLHLALDLREKESELGRAADEARALLGKLWADGEADWDQLQGVTEWAGRLRSTAVRATADPARAAELRQRWAAVATQGRELLEPDGNLGRTLLAYRMSLEGFLDSRNVLVRLLQLDEERAWGCADVPDALGRTRDAVRRWHGATLRLREWCAWRRARREAVELDLGPVVQACESGTAAPETLHRVFDRAFFSWLVQQVRDAEPVLARFSGPDHERRIKQFRSLDVRFTELTRDAIAALLTSRLPAGRDQPLANSELGILNHEIRKKRRHMPVRRLLERIPHVLPRLKPCLLMSPLSVAQYLAPSYPRFDVVIFDEASQIPVWDAIGALARGRQAVVVGDPKQLPPTNFFSRAEDEDEVLDDEVVEDLESILDDCMGARLPVQRLDWHYRSRRESLITFSNHQYYANRLLTFPSAVTEDSAVSLRPVPDGVYDKGRSRTNRKEAEEVVAEVVRRLRDPDSCRRTIGVVTFSQAQQGLIEDLLEEKRRQDPSIEAFFSSELEEPVFVKNLENVQGDERDVILFSVCYGPDAAGKVSMNFGPLNKDGGERRLNVAVTRAREEVLVFSTLRSDQIDLVRTRARGVRDLKGFLAYAERGVAALAEQVSVDGEADVESPFEREVLDALKRKGWDVRCQVGCSGYRIDLAVVDPRDPGRFLLGVECDGANYHSARTARDRDRLRAQILQGLGWALHRIWSTDWWADPAGELEKLDTRLREILEAGEALERVERAKKSPETVLDQRSAKGSKASSPGASSDPSLLASRSGRVTSGSLTPAARHDEERAPGPTVSTVSPARQVAQDDNGGPPVYRPFSVGVVLGEQAEFYDSRNDRSIAETAVRVVRQEGPIEAKLLAKRVAACWGFSRVYLKARNRVFRLLPKVEVVARQHDGRTFYWPADLDPDGFTIYRIPGDHPDSARKLDEIPPEEYANACLDLLRRHVSLPRDELIRETAQLFGCSRVTDGVREEARRGLDLLLASRSVELLDNVVILRRDRG